MLSGLSNRMVSYYAIAILLLSSSGLGWLLLESHEATGKAETELAYQETREAAFRLHTTLIADEHKKNLEDRDNAVLQAERQRYVARKAANRAQNELDKIKSSECFDSPLPDDVLIGLRMAVDSYTGVPAASCMPDDTIGVTGAGAFSSRDIAEYSVQLAESLTVCNGKLESIRGLSNE